MNDLYVSSDGTINDKPHRESDPYRFPAHDNGILNNAKYNYALLAQGLDKNDYFCKHTLRRYRVIYPTDGDNYTKSKSHIHYWHKSHDNISALYFLTNLNNEWHTPIASDSTKIYQPRSYLYWKIISGDLYPSWYWLVLISIFNLWTSINPWKYNNGKFIRKTDNEFIMMLMYQCYFNRFKVMRFFGWICNLFLKLKYGKNIYKKMVKLSLNKYPDHPVRVEWEKIPSDFKWWRQ